LGKKTVTSQKSGVVEEFDKARGPMRKLLAEVNQDLEIYPDWKIKDLLAHLVGWDDATILALKAHNQGKYPHGPAVRGIDVFNFETVAEHTDLKFAQIVQEWELIREQLISLLIDMPEETLKESIISAWGII
jgi:hypothetical protein